jgi:hypothetical protein
VNARSLWLKGFCSFARSPAPKATVATEGLTDDDHKSVEGMFTLMRDMVSEAFPALSEPLDSCSYVSFGIPVS